MSNFKFQISNKKKFIRNCKLEIANLKFNSGFTLVELLVIMGISAILFLLISMNFSDARTGTSLTTTGDTLLSDLKSQQTKAMVGDTEGRGIPDTYGVYIKPTSYVLFHGESYVPASTDNFEIKAADGVTLSTTFPSGTIIFATNSGDLVNFNAAQNQIIVKDAYTTRQKVIQFNKLGTVVALN